MFCSDILPKVRDIDADIANELQLLLQDYAKASDAVINPLHVEQWRELLVGHPEEEIKVGFIVNGYPLGLKPGIDPNKLSKRVHNFVNNKRDVLKEIQRMRKELNKNQIVPGHGHYQLNLLCVPKKDGATGLMTEIRVARHGSYPTVTSKWIALNDAITEEARRTKLPQFEDYVRQLYPYRFATLRDLKDAFRQLLLALSDREYVQYCIFALRFRDLRVAYGQAGAAACCQDFSMMIIWICENKVEAFADKPGRMSVHVDDFLIVANSEPESDVLAAAFDKLCARLGVLISVEKNETSIQRGIVHGFGFNLSGDVKTVYVPTDKACDLTFGCLVLLECKVATGEAIEALMGKIMHWTRLKRRAKVLCNRGIRQLHDQIRKMPKHKKKWTLFKVSEGLCLDISLFLRFFLLFREVSMASILYQPTTTISASTDASSTAGGFLCANVWHSYTFNDQPNCMGRIHKEMHINLKEAHAVIMMLYHCRRMLTGRKVLIFIDNQACMRSIIKAWSKSRALMDFVQEISMLMMTFCIEVHVEYIESAHNIFADLLSRDGTKGDQEFLDLAKLFNTEVKKAENVEYYDFLRIMHSPLPLPCWLNHLEHLLHGDFTKKEIEPELLKIFSKDEEN